MTNNVILVAIDYSDECSAAYREALSLSALLGVSIRLVHVAERHDQDSAARANKWLGERGIAPDQVITLPGTAWVQIARHAEDISPLFLVVGSHGRTGYQPLTPGSTTALLMARSPVPVLVVPSKPMPVVRRALQNPISSGKRTVDA
jgi:nucleotide-binding universal stress UspA family protein